MSRWVVASVHLVGGCTYAAAEAGAKAAAPVAASSQKAGAWTWIVAIDRRYGSAASRRSRSSVPGQGEVNARPLDAEGMVGDDARHNIADHADSEVESYHHRRAGSASISGGEARPLARTRGREDRHHGCDDCLVFWAPELPRWERQANHGVGPYFTSTATTFGGLILPAQWRAARARELCSGT